MWLVGTRRQVSRTWRSHVDADPADREGCTVRAPRLDEDAAELAPSRDQIVGPLEQDLVAPARARLLESLEHAESAGGGEPGQTREVDVGSQQNGEIEAAVSRRPSMSPSSAPPGLPARKECGTRTRSVEPALSHHTVRRSGLIYDLDGGQGGWPL
jgi:hypothetical protein